MRRSGKGSGGGAGMNKVVHPGYRGGAPNRAIGPGGAAQIGISIGTHITEKRTESNYRGEKFYGGAAIASKLGNELTMVPAKPGGGRTVMRSGAQGQHGPVNPGQSPARRDILSEYGSDKPNYRR